MKLAYSETYKVSKTFDAPLDFVYSWCTDFQEDDLKMIGSKNIRRIHEKTKDRVIWTVEGRTTPAGTQGVRAVWLKPPNGWRLESAGDGFEVGEYKLRSLGKNRTRLDMTFTAFAERKSGIESSASYVKDANAHWEGYGAQLMKDYSRSLGQKR